MGEKLFGVHVFIRPADLVPDLLGQVAVPLAEVKRLAECDHQFSAVRAVDIRAAKEKAVEYLVYAYDLKATDEDLVFLMPTLNPDTDEPGESLVFEIQQIRELRTLEDVEDFLPVCDLDKLDQHDDAGGDVDAGSG
jgi:hypothetical protein